METTSERRYHFDNCNEIIEKLCLNFLKEIKMKNLWQVLIFYRSHSHNIQRHGDRRPYTGSIHTRMSWETTQISRELQDCFKKFCSFQTEVIEKVVPISNNNNNYCFCYAGDLHVYKPYGHCIFSYIILFYLAAKHKKI